MLGFTDLWLFLGAAMMVIITPGPDMAIVAAHAARRGFVAGAAAAFGIAAGCLVHIAFAAIGLSAILATSAIAFTVLKFIGAAYLVYLGISLLVTSRSSPGVALAPETATGSSLIAVFGQGFLSNVLNPKVALFFLAFLPQVIPAGVSSKAAAFAALGLTFNLIATLWLLAFAGVAARLGAVVRPGGAARAWIDRVLGAVFVGLGVRLAFLQRTA
jgi:threonine/homoserine/homoserine lactone efflux protein